MQSPGATLKLKQVVASQLIQGMQCKHMPSPARNGDAWWAEDFHEVMLRFILFVVNCHHLEKKMSRCHSVCATQRVTAMS